MKKITIALLIFIVFFSGSTPSTLILNKSHPLASGMVACWPFNEQSGKKAVDLVGYVKQGTLDVDAYFKPSIKGTTTLVTANVSGSRGIDLGTPAILKFSNTSPFSISFWIFPTSSSGGDIMALADVCCSSQGWYLDWGAVGANRINFDYYDGSNFTRVTTDVSSIPTSQWTHVVVTRDNLNSSTSNSAYINGKPSNNRSNSGTPASISCTHFKLGGRGDVGSGGFPNGFPGYLTNIQIWNRCLTASEAMRLYAEPYAIFIYKKKIF